MQPDPAPPGPSDVPAPPLESSAFVPPPAPSAPSATDSAGVPDVALLPDGVPQRLDPAFVPYERLSGWVTAAVVFVLGPLVLGGMLLWSDSARYGKLAVLGGVWLALVALLVTTTLVLPKKRFERARWTLSRAGLEIRTGVVFRELTSVPRSRVQHLDVTQGPIQRKFGLATLVVHTAGQQHSEVELSGVAHEVALAIRDDLMATGAGDGA
ncbi:MAG: PH domain-containing protein [Planctomycetes bacterium]|nr:PH domain-containing protein [Planctomycetota bacterium]